MGKIDIDDLARIREEASRRISLREKPWNVRVTVHMGTCGIAAGARDVMGTLMEELGRADRKDIQVLASGCIGMCSSEPNVTVETVGEEPIIYQHMTRDKMRQVFFQHILKGIVQTDFALARG